MAVVESPDELVRHMMQMPRWLEFFAENYPEASKEEIDNISFAIGSIYFYGLMAIHPNNCENIAAWVLDLHKEPTESEEGKEATRTLSRAIQDEIQHVLPVNLLPDIKLSSLIQPREQSGMIWVDSLLVDYLSLGGEAARTTAKKIQEKSTAAWKSYAATPNAAQRPAPIELFWLWYEPEYKKENKIPIPAIYILADVLWRDRVQPALAFKKNHVSTLPLEIGRAVLATFGKRGAVLSDDNVLRDGEVIAKIPVLPIKDIARLNDAVLALGSLDMARAIPWLIRKAWEQHGQPNDADIVVDGGLTGFGEQVLGIHSDASDRALRVLDAGANFYREWPGFTASGLWTYSHTRPARNKKAKLCITTSPMLRPHSQFSRKELGPWLVPILPPPPLVGREKDFAPQAFFANHLLLALVEHRSELLDGGALIKPAELERLAESVGLPKKTLFEALDRWGQDGDDGPAFLDIEGKPQRGARYMLADREPYRAARAFLLDGAQRSQDAKESAKKSLATKRATIQGKPRRKKPLSS